MVHSCSWDRVGEIIAAALGSGRRGSILLLLPAS